MIKYIIIGQYKNFSGTLIDQIKGYPISCPKKANFIKLQLIKNYNCSNVEVKEINYEI